jgi:hypothetical protein
VLTEPDEQAVGLYEELKRLYPDHIVAHVAMLQCLEPNEPKKRLPFIENVDTSVIAMAGRIIDIADIIIDKVDQTHLLAYIGTKADHDPDASKTKT